MFDLLVSVVPLALGAAVSPTLLATAFVLLSGGPHPMVRTSGYLVGAAVPLVVIGLTCLFILGQAGVRAHIHLPALIDLTFGAVLLLLTLRSLINRGGSKPPDTLAARTGVVRAVLLGVGMMATNVTTMALFVPAVKDIANARSIGPTGRVAMFVLLVLITLLVVLVPMTLHALAPRRTATLFASVSRGATIARSGAIRSLLSGTFGTFLTVRGIVTL